MAKCWTRGPGLLARPTFCPLGEELLGLLTCLTTTLGTREPLFALVGPLRERARRRRLTRVRTVPAPFPAEFFQLDLQCLNSRSQSFVLRFQGFISRGKAAVLFLELPYLVLQAHALFLADLARSVVNVRAVRARGPEQLRGRLPIFVTPHDDHRRVGRPARLSACDLSFCTAAGRKRA